MEPLIAVYRVLDTKDKTEKYGFTWIKNRGEAVVKVRAKAETYEKLQCIWTIDWRNPLSNYDIIFGEASTINKRPAEDIAMQLRKQHIKEKHGPNKGPPWHRRDYQRRQEVRDVVVAALEQARNNRTEGPSSPLILPHITIGNNNKPQVYKPPYTIRYAEAAV